jgi:hypothetical protein
MRWKLRRAGLAQGTRFRGRSPRRASAEDPGAGKAEPDGMASRMERMETRDETRIVRALYIHSTLPSTSRRLALAWAVGNSLRMPGTRGS